jgi:hypothetical protein
MDATVGESEWVAYQFPYLLTLLGGDEEVARIARETGAFARPRDIKRVRDLLQLLMLWAVADCSLRQTAALAAEAGLADVSNVALLKRFDKCGAFVGELLGRTLARVSTDEALSFHVRLFDATVVSIPGSKGTDCRVHLSMRLPSGRIDQVEITDARGGETLDRFEFAANDLVIGDRGYAHRPGLQSVVEKEAFFIVRMPFQNIPLVSETGEKLDILATLRGVGEAVPGEAEVAVDLPNGTRLPCRLIAMRKTEAATADARKKILADAKRKGRTVTMGALEMAAFVCVLTNLPSSICAARVLELYAMRWQVEMKFKTLKSVLRLADVRAKDPQRVQVYVGVKLLAALLIEQLSVGYDSFSPWGYPFIAGSAPRHRPPFDIRSIVD